eukprot:12886051-Prorocentrum_lima.AAC.1
MVGYAAPISTIHGSSPSENAKESVTATRRLSYACCFQCSSSSDTTKSVKYVAELRTAAKD